MVNSSVLRAASRRRREEEYSLASRTTATGGHTKTPYSPYGRSVGSFDSSTIVSTGYHKTHRGRPAPHHRRHDRRKYRDDRSMRRRQSYDTEADVSVITPLFQFGFFGQDSVDQDTFRGSYEIYDDDDTYAEYYESEDSSETSSTPSVRPTAGRRTCHRFSRERAHSHSRAYRRSGRPHTSSRYRGRQESDRRTPRRNYVHSPIYDSVQDSRDDYGDMFTISGSRSYSSRSATVGGDSATTFSNRRILPKHYSGANVIAAPSRHHESGGEESEEENSFHQAQEKCPEATAVGKNDERVEEQCDQPTGFWSFFTGTSQEKDRISDGQENLTTAKTLAVENEPCHGGASPVVAEDKEDVDVEISGGNESSTGKSQETPNIDSIKICESIFDVPTLEVNSSLLLEDEAGGGIELTLSDLHHIQLQNIDEDDELRPVTQKFVVRKIVPGKKATTAKKSRGFFSKLTKRKGSKTTASDERHTSASFQNEIDPQSVTIPITQQIEEEGPLDEEEKEAESTIYDTQNLVDDDTDVQHSFADTEEFSGNCCERSIFNHHDEISYISHQTPATLPLPRTQTESTSQVTANVELRSKIPDVLPLPRGQAHTVQPSTSKRTWRKDSKKRSHGGTSFSGSSSVPSSLTDTSQYLAFGYTEEKQKVTRIHARETLERVVEAPEDTSVNDDPEETLETDEPRSIGKGLTISNEAINQLLQKQTPVNASSAKVMGDYSPDRTADAPKKRSKGFFGRFKLNPASKHNEKKQLREEIVRGKATQLMVNSTPRNSNFLREKLGL